MEFEEHEPIVSSGVVIVIELLDLHQLLLTPHTISYAPFVIILYAKKFTFQGLQVYHTGKVPLLLLLRLLLCY